MGSWSPFFKTMKETLMSLKTEKGYPIYKCPRNTCVVGLIIAMDSIEKLFRKYVTQEELLQFLPTYKLSQDGLELLFSSVRARFGRNNNPDSLQLEYAMRRMLTVRINPSGSSNCTAQDDTALAKVCPLSSICNPDLPSEQEEDYPWSDCSDLSLFVKNVVVHIAGFVAKKLHPRLKCRLCSEALIHDDPFYTEICQEYLLLTEKNNGGLCVPSEHLVAVCKVAESTIRQHLNHGSKSIKKQAIIRSCQQILLQDEYLFRSLRIDYEEDHTPLSDHVFNLITQILTEYIKIRLHHVAKQETLQHNPVTLRNQMNKLVIFNGN